MSARPVPGPRDSREDPRYVVEESPRRVRAVFGGEVVADSTRVRLLFETGKLPVYYFPRADIRADLVSETSRREQDPVKGERVYFDLSVGERTARAAAWRCAGNPARGEDIGELVAFDWSAMDAWYEEDEEVFVHARDPYSRIDVLESSRHVQIDVDGVRVAESRRPMMLFETGLPTRYYLPKVDVRMDLLERSERRTACPYKGTAGYFHVRAGGRVAENIAWIYAAPIPEAAKIAGRICFFDEKVDVTVDGIVQERPRSKWS